MNYSTPSARASRAVRDILHARGESQEQLAEATGIALSTLKRRLLNVSPFTINELFVIARHFGLDITQVLASPMEKVAA